MSKPAIRHRRIDVLKQQKKSLVWLVLLILLAILLDFGFFAGQMRFAKSLTYGGVLAYLSNILFAWYAYKETRARFRQQIVHNMYLGQMLKWGVTILGFALIFSQLATMAWAVILGYAFMHLMHSISMLMIRH